MKVTMIVFFAALAAALAPAQVVPMTNNECSNAITVYEGVNPGAPAGLSGYFYTNVGATSSAGSPVCTLGGYSYAPGADVWFNYTATATATMIFKTCTPPGFAAGTCTDTMISLFGPGPCPAGALIRCNDDWDFCIGENLISAVAAAVTSGVTYRIRVSENSHPLYGGPPGTFYLMIATSPVQNDVCEHPIALGPGMNGPFTNIGGTGSNLISACEPSGGYSDYVDVWFTVGGCIGPVTISTCGSSSLTVLSVWSACGGSEIACNDDDPNCPTYSSSTVTFVTTTTAPYLVRVSVNCIACLGSIHLNVTWGGLCLHYSSPSGPGSVKVDMTGGPPLGNYLYAVTFTGGAFPAGWFLGVDIPLAELFSEYSSGFPFFAPLSASGTFAIGPVTGLGALSGTTVYSVAVGFPVGGAPIVSTPPVAYTLP